MCAEGGAHGKATSPPRDSRRHAAVGRRTRTLLCRRLRPAPGAHPVQARSSRLRRPTKEAAQCGHGSQRHARRADYHPRRETDPLGQQARCHHPEAGNDAASGNAKAQLRGEIKRLIITVPPRSLKSICALVAFPAFVLGHYPTRRIICVSYAEALARKHANDCRALMRSTLYHRLFPNTRISNAKDTELEFATTRGGNRLATSIGGTLTGRGGNLIVIDDPLKPQDAYSEAARENTKQWYSNTLLSRLDDKTKDAIIVVMQRLHLDDLVGHLLEQEGWTHLNLPAIAESEFRIPLGPGRYHLRRVGDLLHPEREPREVLDEFKRSMGSLDFAAQYQQEPVAEGGNLIKWDWFQFYDKPPRSEERRVGKGCST